MRFEMYKGHDKQWRWRLVATNGNIIADSAESYRRKKDCLAAIRSIQTSASTADVLK